MIAHDATQTLRVRPETRQTSQKAEQTGTRAPSTLIDTIYKLYWEAIVQQNAQTFCGQPGQSVVFFARGNIDSVIGAEPKTLSQNLYPNVENGWRSQIDVRVNGQQRLSAEIVDAGFFARKPSTNDEHRPVVDVLELPSNLAAARSAALVRLGYSDARIALTETGEVALRTSVDISQLCERRQVLNLAGLYELFRQAEALEHAGLKANSDVKAFRMHKFKDAKRGQAVQVRTQMFKDSTHVSLRSSIHAESPSDLIAVSETVLRRGI